MKPRLYLCYSDLFDHRPTMAELITHVEGIPIRHAAFVLSYMNSVVRCAMQEKGRENFGKVQEKLVIAHLDDECFNLLKQRFATVRCEERPTFLPRCLLNVMRVVLIHGDPDIPFSDDDDQRIRYLIGRACLMMNDLLVSVDEMQALKTGTPDERRIELMVQSLAGFELENPPRADHLMPRLAIMYRTLLRDPKVRARIAQEYQGFDLEQEFERNVGVSLERWLLVVFSIYAYFSNIGSPLNPDPNFLQINPSVFRGASGITEEEFTIVLETISAPSAEMRLTLQREGRTDPRYDLVPFRSAPLLELEKLKLVPIDLAFILEKCHTGVQWTLHDALPVKLRQTLFNVWGILFEEYVHWLLGGMKTILPMLYVPSPTWNGSVQESFDGVLLKGDVLVAAEYKGGFLARDARYSGNSKMFLDDLNKKFADGCKQLADNIGAAFSEDRTIRKEVQGLNLAHVRAVVPVLVLQDHILRVPFLNWYLNRQFREELGCYKLRGELVVRPLTVLNVHELESMIHSAEAENFDFIYALHNRTVRDKEVLSDVLDFLGTFPEFGRKASPRIAKVLEDLFETITAAMFPGVQGSRVQLGSAKELRLPH